MRRAGTIPAALKSLATLTDLNTTLDHNQLNDCGIQNSATDCGALLNISAAWGLWAGQTGTSYCSGWAGVACDGGTALAGGATQFRVARLSLGSRGLAGAVLPALGSLAALVQLDLSSNQLTGVGAARPATRNPRKQAGAHRPVMA